MSEKKWRREEEERRKGRKKERRRGGKRGGRRDQAGCRESGSGGKGDERAVLDRFGREAVEGGGGEVAVGGELGVFGR